MKKIFLSLVSLLLCGNLFAAGINEIVFFGDSLTDNGNLYDLVKVIPRSPPYYNGRFTNGPTWAENLGAYYHKKLALNYSIYAYGGATTIFHEPTDRFVAPTTLEGELLAYYTNTLFSDKDSTLFVFWIGANDYLFDENSNPDGLTSDVVNKITDTISELIGKGGKHFLVLNLPDMSKAPFANSNNMVARLQKLSEMHNDKLAKSLLRFKDLAPAVTITTVDIYQIFNDLVAHPEKYNEKYKAHLSQLTAACWMGGLTRARPEKIQAAEIKSLLEKSIPGQDKHFTNNFKAQGLTRFILKSPSLKQAYLTAKLQDDGFTPCADPDQYVFWDEVHPTEVVHQMISAISIEALNTQLPTLLNP